jgi:hypothetical protein
MENYYLNLDLQDIVYVNHLGEKCVEVWKDVPNYEGLYKVSDLGRVKSLKRPRKKSENNPNSYIKERIMKASVSTRYLSTALRKNGISKVFLVHHLVSIAFIDFKPNKGNIVVDHINNNPLDNRLINFQLITKRHNSVKDVKNKAEHVGLYERNGFFEVTIGLKGKRCYLGAFKNKEQAIKKRLEAYNLIEDKQDISHLIKKRTNKTNFKGVYIINHKFTAQIRHNGFTRNLGSFKTIDEASFVYELALSLKKQNKSIDHLVKKRKNRL